MLESSQTPATLPGSETEARFGDDIHLQGYGYLGRNAGE